MSQGIAFGGHKCAGKDEALAYVLATRANFMTVRCKTPIVQGYEYWKSQGNAVQWLPDGTAEHVTVPVPATFWQYVKERDDREMIWYSKNILRTFDNLVVAKYLEKRIPDVIRNEWLPAIPDMRFPEEAKTCADLGLTLIKIEASEEVRKQRMMQVYGNLNHWVPDDPSEKYVDSLKYNYIVTNEGSMVSFHLQLERVISRYYPRRPAFDMEKDYTGMPVQIINCDDERFGRIGVVMNHETTSVQVSLSTAEKIDIEHFFVTDVLINPPTSLLSL